MMALFLRQVHRVIAAVVLTMSLPVTAADAPLKDWQSPHLREHALVGKIWSAETRGFISAEDYGKALRAADIVLLGENHDNADHHRLQAWAVSQVASAGREGALVFEMIGPDEAPALADALAQGAGAETAAMLGAALRWEERGWPSWQMYEPIARAALAARFSLHPGDAAPATIREVAKSGFPVLGAHATSLGLDGELDTALNAALMDELYDGHCQMLDKSKLGPMANVQRLRDAMLAANVKAARPPDGVAVLIAGNGHVRKDRGVPSYLAGGEARVLALMHLEVSDGVDDPLALVPKSPDGAPALDYVIFTPGAERGDPCEVFRKMKK